MSFDSDKTVVGGMPGGESTQMVGTPLFEATQYAASVECPVCHTPNPPSETYCMDCGFMLNSAPVEVAELAKAAPVGKLVSSDGVLEFALRAGENSVGREGTDVLLSNNTVSRKHGRVIVENGSVYVEDLGSTNGTYVDGARIQPNARVEVKDASELTFGSMMLRYCAPEAAEQEPEVEEDTAIIGNEPVENTEADAPDVMGDEELAEEVGEEPAEEPIAGPVGQLVAKDGGAALPIVDGLNTIGRRDGVNTIVVADPYCSGRHADLSVQDGTFMLTDIGSTNGTLVNGVRLEPNVPRQLYHGDEITLGAPVFRLEVSDV